jgi:predicted phage terminase large subunit-like protein
LQEAIIQEAKKELARRNFWDFCLYYDVDFFTKRAFLKQIADGFMKIHNGEILRLSVSMPPRAGKSYITSLFCAWTLAKKPTESVMRNTCTATLYEKFSYDVRTIVKSDKFVDVFPNIKLAGDKQSISGWNLSTAKQVSYFGNGVGGTIIGFGASALAITDDLYKSLEDALSDTNNDKTHSWKQSAHDSRLEKCCPQIDIGTRWTKRDVIGKMTEDGRYDLSIVVPALIDGKSFCEDVKTTEEYLDIKANIDAVIFEAEYMQNPIEAKGLLFPKNELNYFKPSSLLDEQFESSIAYIDVADEGSDYLSMPIGRNIKDKIYITDVVFTRENADVGLELCVAALNKGAQYCRVESNNMGAMFARNIQKKLNNTQIYTAVSTTNKHTRIIMDAGFIKRHCYFLEKEYQSDQYRQFIENLCSYLKEGKSKHDDAADSMSGLVLFIRTILNHYY